MGELSPCPDGRCVPNPRGEDVSFPYPAPYLPVNTKTALSDFNSPTPKGEWQLYVREDDEFDDADGLFTQRFALDMQTRPKAKVAFAQTAVDVTDGEIGKLTVTRSGAPTSSERDRSG
jgi:hypothetical protein